MEKILIVEDDFFIRDGLFDLLTRESYAPTAVQSLAEARSALSSVGFSLIILDVMLPDGNGLDLCSELRSKGLNTPILFLTACDDELQIVRGLDSGADDYVTKPFRLLELLSRIRALLRRKGASESVQSGSIKLDLDEMTVKKDGASIFLTPTEYRILSKLMLNKGITVTRAALLQGIWDDNENFIDDNTLSVHISRLREKIGSEHITTVRGIGYRWEDGNG